MKEAVPFLKWAGGKRQLLPEILSRLPERCVTYYEPFLGGGAVFFALVARGAFRRAIIGDQNRELVDAYLGVRDDVEGVISRLARLSRKPHDSDTYYGVRAQDPARLGLAARTARLIYLNRTGYNGLYRVNRTGRFNVPFGRYKNPRILDRDNLRAASRAMQGVQIRVGDFEAFVEKAEPGDVVYFDPPYVPVSTTSSFTAYDRLPFGPAEQDRLARTLRRLRKKRVYALLSNSDVRFTRGLYEGLPLEAVKVNRLINSRPDRRGPISEMLVSSLSRIPAPPA